MKKLLCSIAGLSFALAGSLVARAQTPAAPPPNILYIETDNIKAYESEPYDKVAAEYPPVSRQVKAATHYLAMEAVTGSPRAIYLFDYDSYEAWQKDTESLLGNATVHEKFAALDKLESQYVSEVHNTIWHYRPDLSENVAGADLPHSHYWEVVIFHMRPGHDAQFDELTKLYKDANVKIGQQNIPWATYEGMNGATDSYPILIPMTSLKDEDTGLAHEKDFGAALGEEGARRMDKLSEEGVTSVEDNLYMVNPAASYINPDWVKADPGYWAPKPTVKPAPKPAAGAPPAPKPAPAQ
jgi:hypothetical protein